MNKQKDQAKGAFYSELSRTDSLCLPLDLKMQLFDHIVLPVMLCGCEVWGFDHFNQLEAFHVKFCKN